MQRHVPLRHLHRRNRHALVVNAATGLRRALSVATCEPPYERESILDFPDLNEDEAGMGYEAGNRMNLARDRADDMTSDKRPIFSRPNTEFHGDESGAGDLWTTVPFRALDEQRLRRNRVISEGRRRDPSHMAFDVLRTQMLRVFRERGWRSVGITSPTKGCGKTFVATNLAFSVARHAQGRAVLVDMDLRMPSLAEVLGVQTPGRLSDFFRNGSVETHFLRVSDRLVVGLNAQPEEDAAELVQDPRTHWALAKMQAALTPQTIIYDLPPMLACDDVLGFLPQLDCILLIVGGGLTQPSEIKKCERLLKDQKDILGMVLNRAEDPNSHRYQYGHYGR